MVEVAGRAARTRAHSIGGGLLALIALAVVLCGWILGTLALAWAYSIPTQGMHEALASSSETIQWQKERPLVDGTGSTKVDTFTDAAMLGFAGMPGKGKPALEQAMESVGPKKLENKWAPQAALENLVSAEDYEGPTHSYLRYWHGYLVWLKPALALGCDLDAIHAAKYLLQLSLIAAVAVLLALRGRAVLVPAFLVAVFGIRCWMVPQCLQYSSVFEIALAACVVYLAFFRRFATRRGLGRFALFLFLVTGMATSYADLLTYPLFTLGLPLLVMLGVRGDAAGDLRGSLRLVLVACLAWAAGYGLMWVGKWVVASIVLQRDCFADALAAAGRRGGSTARGHELALREIVAKTGKHYLTPAMLAMTAAVLVASIVRIAWLIRHRRATLRDAFIEALPYLAVAILPFAWYYALKNHSYVHAFFTYRTLAVALGALLFAFASTESRVSGGVRAAQPPARGAEVSNEAPVDLGKCAANVVSGFPLACSAGRGYTINSRPKKTLITTEIEGNDNGLHPRH